MSNHGSVTVLLVLVSIVAISCVFGRKTLDSQTKKGNDTAALKRGWLKYKAKYGKEYSDASEDSMRFQIWAKQHQEHKELKKSKGYKKSLTGSDGQTFQHFGAGGPNYLSDWTEDELDLLSGLEPLSEDELKTHKEMEAPLGFTGDDDSPLPEFVDWRLKGAVTPVQLQGKCESCWAFASAAVLEGQRKIVSDVLEKLSEQNIMDCQAGWKGCRFPYYIARGLDKSVKEGLQSGDSYPYNRPEAKNDQCGLHSSNVLDGLTDAVEVLRVTAGDEQELKRVVALHGPVAVAVHSDSPSFRKYTKADGVYKNEPLCAKQIDHAVTLVGYGTDEDTKEEYWLIKNSWGEGWGDGGYMRLARNANGYCGIAKQAMYVILNPPTGAVGAAANACDGKQCGCTPTGFCWAAVDNSNGDWCHTNARTTSKDSTIARLEICKYDDGCSSDMVCNGCHRNDDGKHICPKKVNGFQVLPGDCNSLQNEIKASCGITVDACAAECSGDGNCKGFIFSDDPNHPMNDCKDSLCVTKNAGCTDSELFENEKPGLFWYRKK